MCSPRFPPITDCHLRSVANDLIVGSRGGTTAVASTGTGIVLLGGGSVTFNNTSGPIQLGVNTVAGGNGTGTLTISGTNNYTGPTAISSGTLALGASNALPASNIQVGTTLLAWPNNYTLGSDTATSTPGVTI